MVHPSITDSQTQCPSETAFNNLEAMHQNACSMCYKARPFLQKSFHGECTDCTDSFRAILHILVVAHQLPVELAEDLDNEEVGGPCASSGRL